MLEFIPVYVTESRVIGDHMALYLGKGAIRPDIVNDNHKYTSTTSSLYEALTAKSGKKRLGD